jgi:hypothetical protein
LIFDLSPTFERYRDEEEKIAEIAMSRFDLCTANDCHSEHREEPMHLDGAGKMHRSFASLRMTRFDGRVFGDSVFGDSVFGVCAPYFRERHTGTEEDWEKAFGIEAHGAHVSGNSQEK